MLTQMVLTTEPAMLAIAPANGGVVAKKVAVFNGTGGDQDAKVYAVKRGETPADATNKLLDFEIPDGQTLDLFSEVGTWPLVNGESLWVSASGAGMIAHAPVVQA